ncbi:UNVERIFIED_CONTAM: hypothetical protein GTU68_000085 [Idotea baltica]|nr:hypothetical protein [Idotea baltica]
MTSPVAGLSTPPDQLTPLEVVENSESAETVDQTVAVEPGRTARVGLKLTDLTKEFPLGRNETVRALDDISLTVEPGEFVALLGPSGCGKSTVLRLLCGLEDATSGEVSIGDRLGVAFQEHALLPWASIWDNVALPFKVAGQPVDSGRIDSLLALVGISEFAKARPKQLSGGMRQRASIARALALRPEVLLLDEPFGALDAVTRRRMNIELQDIWTADQVTTLLVTHSVDEAVFLADRVIVMTGRPGRIAMIREPGFERPRGPELLRSPEFHEVVDELTAALDESEADPT